MLAGKIKEYVLKTYSYNKNKRKWRMRKWEK